MVVLTGPRQSGKTTLARVAFAHHAYVSLEDPDARERVGADPRGLLAQHRGGLVVDRDMAHADRHSSHVATYVERDVQQISRIADLLQFQRFMRMMAARAGQLLNLNAVANDLGIAQTTAAPGRTMRQGRGRANRC